MFSQSYDPTPMDICLTVDYPFKTDCARFLTSRHRFHSVKPGQNFPHNDHRHDYLFELDGTWSTWDEEFFMRFMMNIHPRPQIHPENRGVMLKLLKSQSAVQLSFYVQHSQSMTGVTFVRTKSGNTMCHMIVPVSHAVHSDMQGWKQSFHHNRWHQSGSLD